MPSGLTKDWGQTFTIDIWGNLTNINVERCSTPILNAPVNERNQFVGTAYDAAGNLWGNWQYPFDAENRMVGTAGVTYTYDGDGKRVKKSGGTLYWTGVGSDSLAESDLAGTLTAEYVFFGGKRMARLDLPSGVAHYYFSDHLGSHSVVTSANGGTIEQEADYYPFGGERAITAGPTNYKFTGKERDGESGLDYFGARYYGSGWGRFTSPDLLGGRNDDPQTWNRYAYVTNNPLKYNDPTGKRRNPVTGESGINPVPAQGEKGLIRRSEQNPQLGQMGYTRDGGARYHPGTDINAQKGTPVVAPISGTVKFDARDPNGYGLRATITSPDGKTTTTLNHLSGKDPLVQNLGMASEGQRVGFSGDSGNAQGLPADQQHVHMNVSVEGNPVNPVDFLNEPIFGQKTDFTGVINDLKKESLSPPPPPPEPEKK